MHRVVLLLSCDSCAKVLSQASVCDQPGADNWRLAVSQLSRKIALQFDLLRGRARRTGWHCADPCMLCLECANNEKRFADTPTKEMKDNQ
jgi:hypothetical protein